MRRGFPAVLPGLWLRGVADAGRGGGRHRRAGCGQGRQVVEGEKPEEGEEEEEEEEEWEERECREGIRERL